MRSGPHSPACFLLLFFRRRNSSRASLSVLGLDLGGLVSSKYLKDEASVPIHFALFCFFLRCALLAAEIVEPEMVGIKKTSLSNPCSHTG